MDQIPQYDTWKAEMLEENMGSTLQNTDVRKDFLNSHLAAQELNPTNVKTS